MRLNIGLLAAIAVANIKPEEQARQRNHLLEYIWGQNMCTGMLESKNHFMQVSTDKDSNHLLLIYGSTGCKQEDSRFFLKRRKVYEFHRYLSTMGLGQYVFAGGLAVATIIYATAPNPNVHTRHVGNYTVRDFPNVTEVTRQCVPNSLFPLCSTSWVDTARNGNFDVRIGVVGIGRSTSVIHSSVTPSEQKLLERVVAAAR